MMKCDQNDFSLLWVDKRLKTEQGSFKQENSSLIKDLELERIAAEMSIDNYHRVSIDTLLSNATDNCTTIAYRLDIVEDLLNNPELVDGLLNILPMLDELVRVVKHDPFRELNLLETVKRISELGIYAQCVLTLKDTLSRAAKGINSKGFNHLLDLVNNIAEQESFLSLQRELPKLQIGIRNVSSVTIGINLDSMLCPKEAILVSINEQPYKEQSLFNRIASKFSSEDDLVGITPLYRFNKTTSSENFLTGDKKYDAFFHALNNNLETLLRSVISPLVPVVNKFINTNTSFLAGLLPEFCYLLGAVKLLRKFQSGGLPICKPQVAEMEKRVCIAEKSYNAILAFNLHSRNPGVDLRGMIVLNDICFGDQSRISVLTGPNQGGKTTYIQSIGIVQILFQLGVFVPGTQAQISPVDRLFTHFPVEETFDSNVGRMAEECDRLHQIFCEATRFSMILLNESFSSTSSTEALFISREVLLGLKILGTRAIFTTHIHELAADLDIINASIPGDSNINSLVSRVEEEKQEGSPVRRTYRITQGPPIGLSYARDIASRYGISIDKIVSTLRKRCVIDDSGEMNNVDEVYKKIYRDRFNQQTT